MPTAKAVVGAVVAFLTALVAEWTDVDPLEPRDFVVALIAGLVAFGAVYAVRNKPSTRDNL